MCFGTFPSSAELDVATRLYSFQHAQLPGALKQQQFRCQPAPTSASETGSRTGRTQSDQLIIAATILGVSILVETLSECDNDISVYKKAGTEKHFSPVLGHQKKK
ncbi:uncharacterized protein ARMOST_07458 [Armillaria ostoyae]|uniref:Uncharacterized protein n=1 Tax=Armillaria ostoyae TaxID=47428 RepID=A0A284R5W1_ARMOS|nr:uncharacterized protein ARMOST_07458 [Armillaria ostoyae]